MKLEIYRNLKVLEVHKDYFIGTRGYTLYKYIFKTKKKKVLYKVKSSIYSLLSVLPLTRRFFRAEINSLYNLSDGSKLIIAKKGIYKCPNGEGLFKKCFDIKRGSRPLNICITPNNNIFFGEYYANVEKSNVNVYCSKDKGETWQIAYTFEPGQINHIHGIFWDKYEHCMWIVTGDRENECIIANTKDEFKTLNIVFRGGQDYRCCQIFFYEDYVIFATDSQYMENEIRMFKRGAKEISTLQHVQGSVIKGGQFKNLAFLSTTIEPSKVNRCNESHLWISRNGLNWEDLYSAKKDHYPMIFQFGSIEFPQHYTDEFIMFSGRALKGIDGSSLKIDI